MRERIAIVGAGMSGMTCASTLSDSGGNVTVFDKGRAIGGRMATRHSGDWLFNHGAPSFHADKPAFRNFMDHLVAKGSARCINYDSGLYGGSPNMNELLKPLAATVDIRQSVEIAKAEKTQQGWQLASNRGEVFHGFDTLLICIPAPQAKSLVAAITEGWATPLESVRYDPCLTMLLGTAPGYPELGDRSFEGQQVLDKQISQAVENHDSTSTRQAWVVHAALEWSAQNINREREDIARDMLHEFAHANDLPIVEPAFLRGHRWRYARVSQPLGKPCLWDSDMRLGLAGDWCLGSDVEHAFTSGTTLAKCVMDSAAEG